MTTRLCNILHLSDLHMGEGDPGTDADFLLADIEQQFKRDAATLRRRYRGQNVTSEMNADSADEFDIRPEICIVSGDIATRGDEYDVAEQFLARLADRLFEGQRERVVVVPGNHDVYWPASENAYQRIAYSDEDYGLARDPMSLVRSRNERQTIALFRRLKDLYSGRFYRFVEFYERFYRHRRTYPLTRHRDFSVHVFNPRVVIVGFNSCAYVDHLNSVPLIEKQTIFQAAETLKQRSSEIDERAVRIAVWHHGLFTGSMARDYLPQAMVETLAINKFSLALHGHMHEAQYKHAQSALGWTIPVVGAGSLRVGGQERPESVPRQYNVVSLYDSQVVVYSRRRRDEHSAWMADPGWTTGDPGWDSADGWVRVSPLPSAVLQTGERSLDNPRLVARDDRVVRSAAILAEPPATGGEEAVRRSARAVVTRVRGVGLEDPRFLFGRQLQLRFVLEQVLRHGANKCIEGPQWVGKTSFLQALCDERVRRWVRATLGGFDDTGSSWCYVDLRDHRTEDAVAEAVSELVAKSLGLDEARTPLQRLLPVLAERKQHLVLVLDHFEALLARDKFEGAFPNHLRAISGQGFNVVYAMRTEAMVPRSGREKAHYFHASVEGLDFFDERTARAVVGEPLRIAGYDIPQEAIERLVWLGGRHPYFLAVARQMYANAWDALVEPSWRVALQKASADFEREVQPYYDGLLNGLSEFGQDVLRRIFVENCKVVLRELSPIVGANGAPFSQHVRDYYLSYYLPRRAMRIGGNPPVAR